MKDYLTILHLSDLHFRLDKMPDIEIVKKALFQDLQDLSLQRNIEPDLVAFSGDLVQAGDYKDYETVKKNFIFPLLDTLDLNTSDLFICPGNHDVNRKNINKFTDSGLKIELNDIESVNDLVDNHDKYHEVFNRLNDYFQFLKSVNLANPVSETPLYSTYIIDKDKYKIGIACVNSAWRAYGGEEDYGNLLIGERTIDNCIKDIASCDLRIGIVHHSFSDLAEFERSVLRRLVAEHFHLWLRGHTHQNDAEFTENLQSESTIIVKGGALYKSRNYYNGYAVINCYTNEARIDIYLREYDDRVRQFGRSTKLPGGYVSYDLSSASLVPLNNNFGIISRMRQVGRSRSDDVILPSIETMRDSITLHDIFVEPRLSKESEYTRLTFKDPDPHKHSESEYCSLHDLLESEKNLLILGKKESGKTTLLNYIVQLYTRQDVESAQRVPLMINHDQLPQGKNKILKALKNYLADLDVDFDPKPYLRRGECIILVDDLKPNNRKSLDALKKFIIQYPENLFIVTANEDIFSELQVEQEVDLSNEFQRIYIHSFGREQIRKLAQRLLPLDVEHTINPPQVADTILSNLLESNLPRNPTIVSLMLILIYKQPNRQPVNKAYIMKGFVNILLEKNPFISGWSLVDPAKSEDFLADLSHHMVCKKKTALTTGEATEFVLRYFRDAALDVPFNDPCRFLQYLSERKILIEKGNKIGFRFTCFQEYFIAVKLHKSSKDEFYEEVLSQERYLDFSSEIDYLTGLSRRDQHIVNLMKSRTTKSLKNLTNFLGFEIQLTDLDSLTISHGLMGIDVERRKKNELIEHIQNNRLSEEQKDQISDVSMRLHASEHSSARSSETDPYKEHLLDLANDLWLYATVIRNSDLIKDKSFKANHIKTWAQITIQLLYALILSNLESIDDMDKNDLLETGFGQLEETKNLSSLNIPEFKKRFTDFYNVILFLILQYSISNTIGTPDLRTNLEIEIDNDQNPLATRLLCTMVYMDLKLPGYVDKIEETARVIRNNNYYREVFYTKIRSFLATRGTSLSRKEYQHLAKILVEALTEGDLKSKAIKRSKMLGKMQQEMLKSGH
jgi:predicted phosphodiesterase